MTAEELAKKREFQTEKLYAGLGKFVVDFEGLIGAMRNVISMHVGHLPAPYGAKYQQVANIFTADLTADPLLKTFRSIIKLQLEDYHIQENVPRIEKMLTNLCSRIESINKTRNTFLHGTWFINYASVDQTDFSIAKGMKQTNTAKGLRLDNLEHSEESFAAAANDCSILKDLVYSFGVLLLTGDDMLSNFGMVDNKLVQISATDAKS